MDQPKKYRLDSPEAQPKARRANLAQIWLISIVIIILLLAACTGYYLWANEANQKVSKPEVPVVVNLNTNTEININTEVVTEEEVDEFLAYLKVKNDDQIELYQVDQDGQINLIKEYNNDLGSSSVVEYLFKDGPQIYLDRLGENGYTVLDYQGQDISSDYPYLKKKNFDFSSFIKIPGWERIIYSYGPGEEQVEGRPLFIASYDHSISDYITSDLLPNNISSSRPLGWSADQKDLYVTKIGWEGFEYADLWKVNYLSKEVEHIDQADKIALGELDVNPDLDLAVGIEMSKVDCNECLGPWKGGAPANLYLFDLKNNTSEILIADSPTLIYNPILSPDGQKIFFSEEMSDESSTTYIMDIDGSNKERLGNDLTIEGMSQNGQLVIVNTGDYPNYSYQIMDLENNTQTDIIINGLLEKTFTQFINCNYPLGFSCLYY